ncbi:MAG: glycosyltransferase N-terminal domain-containing protein [Gemmatimonadaceae bacterium]
MNAALRVGYEGAARLARALSAFAPAEGSKLARTFAERRGVLARYSTFARVQASPLLWMHAPSVGEGLQARPVLELARQRMPQLQLAYTYFSPSARDFAAKLDVDFRDVLPFDDTPDMRGALAALQPTALVFSKLDVWPTLVREASARKARLGVVSATLARDSSRLSWLAGAILRDAYARLDLVGAISADDADRLISLGVPASRVRVTGDTRYDQVWARAQGVNRASSLLAPLINGRPTLVAGSTWPADEAVLLPAWERLAAKQRDARLIIAPHEPTPSHLDPIEAWARGAGLQLARLGEDAEREADVVLVDRVGVLGELYALGNAAFVGGAFHSAGLHSVLEPAAFGAPVMFGPLHTGSRDALLLLDEDAAIAVGDVESAAAALERWFASGTERSAAGDAAARAVHRGLGAAERTWSLVSELLSISARR